MEDLNKLSSVLIKFTAKVCITFLLIKKYHDSFCKSFTIYNKKNKKKGSFKKKIINIKSFNFKKIKIFCAGGKIAR